MNKANAAFSIVLITNNKKDNILISKLNYCNIEDHKIVTITYKEAINYISDNQDNISLIVLRPSDEYHTFKLLNYLRNKSIIQKLLIIRENENIDKKVSKMVVSLFDYIPLTSTHKEIESKLNDKISSTTRIEEVKKLIDKYLLKLGATPNLKGYNYLKDAIYSCAFDKNNQLKLNNDLYADLGKKYKTSTTAIESAIRRLIEKIMEIAPRKLKSKLFSGYLYTNNQETHLSNSVFIKTVANRVNDNSKNTKKLQ